MKEPLLFICHRIPFPPNKGDKIATFNIMKFLNEHYDLHVLSFIDDPFDRQYKSDVEKYCKTAKFVDISSRGQLKSGLVSVATKQPVSLAHYRSSEMQQIVDSVVEENKIDRILVYSSGVAQFVASDKYKDKVRVLNMTDIDSDKWRQYAENKSWPASLIYQREFKLLNQIEQQYLSIFDAVTLVTEDETALFKSLSPDAQSNKISTVGNGVDTEFFDPQAQFDYKDKPESQDKMICFTGAMDYWANVDAVVWFCDHVWPTIKAEFPELKFYIVGSKPTEKVNKLAQLDGVIVTGRVEDVRPYIEQSECCIGPLRIARGIQNKMLEAMAMAKPVVMTKMAAEGIHTNEVQQKRISDDASVFAQEVLELLNNPELAVDEGKANRDWVLEHYGWHSTLASLKQLLG